MIATAVAKVDWVLGSKFRVWRRVGEDNYSCCQSEMLVQWKVDFAPAREVVSSILSQLLQAIVFDFNRVRRQEGGCFLVSYGFGL